MYQHEAERFFPLDEYIRPSDANSALLFGLAAGSLDLLGALWSSSGGDLHTDLQSIKLRHSLEIACASERIDRQMRLHMEHVVDCFSSYLFRQALFHCRCVLELVNVIHNQHALMQAYRIPWSHDHLWCM